MNRLAIIIALAALAPDVALAHTGIGQASAFAAGVAHPLGGFDHLLAMAAVGLWAGLRGGKAVWLWPACFVGAMMVGGALGIERVPLPFVEQGILASILALGLAVALALRAPLSIGGLVIAAAGLLHGHAHGAEAPLDASGVQYALGFVLATAALHLAGLGFTLAALKLRAPLAIRLAGVATAVAGLALAFAGA